MEQEIMLRRNAVFDLIYRKAMTAYVMCVPTVLRWFIEVALILMATCVLALWGYVHFLYIDNPGDCLEHITERPLPYDVILQVEAFTNSTHLWDRRELAVADLYQSIHKHEFKFSTTEEEKLRTDHSPQTRDTGTRLGLGTNICEYLAVFGFKICCNSRVRAISELNSEPIHTSTSKSESLVTKHHHIGTDNNESTRDQDQVHRGVDQGLDFQEDAGMHTHVNVTQDMTSFADNHSLFELLDFYTLRRYAFDYMILEFAQEPGYLSLTHSSRTRLNITVVKAYIDPENSTCFGGPFGRFISKYFLGYEMMIIASFKNLLPPAHVSGFVKNLMTGGHYYYRVQWMGKWRYGAGILPALFFTLVASILLRQIHYNIFNFLTHFHHLLNEGIPMPIQIGAQLPFLIVTYAAIGFIIVMSEALSDDSMFSLLMMITVWEADQYYSVFCTQEASKKYFPWFFYLYHFLPYAYYIRFNGQFWFIPFMFHWLLLQHTMLFFIHHFEVPAFTLYAPDAGQHPGAEEPRIEHIYEDFHQNAGHGEPSEDESDLSEDESEGWDGQNQTNSPRQLGLTEVQNYRTTEGSVTSEHSVSAHGIEPFSAQECGSGDPSIMVSGNTNEKSLGSSLQHIAGPVYTRLHTFHSLSMSSDDDDDA